MEENKSLKSHTLILENRNKMSISGITDVGGFNEESLFIVTEHGDLTVRGENLQITRLDLDAGEMVAEGMIDEFSYSDLPKKGKKSFFKGL